MNTDALTAPASGFLERWFKLTEHGTNVRTEMVAGLTTFLTMAYIIFVNPSILGDAGMPKGAVFVATCLIAALGTAIMGLYANYPIALAPGMGLNAYFAYVVVLGMGYKWQVALGAVFVSGCLFLLVTLTGLREQIIKGIPDHSGAMVILVDHDMTLVQNVCTWTAVLDFGRLLASGPTAEVLRNPDVLAAYLGTDDVDERHDGDTVRTDG